MIGHKSFDDDSDNNSSDFSADIDYDDYYLDDFNES